MKQTKVNLRVTGGGGGEATYSAGCVTTVTVSKNCKTSSQLSGSAHRNSGDLKIWNFQEVTFVPGRQVIGHGIQRSGSVLQSFCLTSVTCGKEMHRFRQQDQILNIQIIFLSRCKTLILTIKIGMMKKYLPLSQSQHLNEIFQNKRRE